MNIKKLIPAAILATSITYTSQDANSNNSLCQGQYQLNNGDTVISLMDHKSKLFMEGHYSRNDNCFSTIQVWPINSNQRDQSIMVENKDCKLHRAYTQSFILEGESLHVDKNNPISISVGSDRLEDIISFANTSLLHKKEKVVKQCFN